MEYCSESQISHRQVGKRVIADERLRSISCAGVEDKAWHKEYEFDLMGMGKDVIVIVRMQGRDCASCQGWRYETL